MADYISVRIQAQQVVQYVQVVAMSTDEWAEFKRLGERDRLDRLEDLIDPRKVFHAEPLDRMTATVVDIVGDPVEPADQVDAEQ